MMETKDLNLDVKELTAAGTFEGYASTRARDLIGDVIVEGAFKRTIDLHPDGFPILWFHRPDQPVGKSLELREDAHGLYTRGQLNLETTLGREVYSNMKLGIVGSLSIGYRTIQAEFDKSRNVRLVKEVQLYEYSLLTKGFAMQPEAVVTSVKSLDVRRQLRAGLDRLRDAPSTATAWETMSDLLRVLAHAWDDGTKDAVLRDAAACVRDRLTMLLATASPTERPPDDEAGAASSGDSPGRHSPSDHDLKRDSEAIHSLLRATTDDMTQFVLMRAWQECRRVADRPTGA